MGAAIGTLVFSLMLAIAGIYLLIRRTGSIGSSIALIVLAVLTAVLTLPQLWMDGFRSDYDMHGAQTVASILTFSIFVDGITVVAGLITIASVVTVK